jgi:hypothetical protein
MVLKFAQNGVAPAVHLERAREQTRLRTCNPPVLCLAWDRKLIGILTSIVKDCGLLPGGTSSALGWSVIKVEGGGVGICCCQTSDKIMSKCLSKHYFFYITSEVKKFRSLKNPIHKNFVCI